MNTWICSRGHTLSKATNECGICRHDIDPPPLIFTKPTKIASTPKRDSIPSHIQEEMVKARGERRLTFQQIATEFNVTTQMAWRAVRKVLPKCNKPSHKPVPYTCIECKTVKKIRASYNRNRRFCNKQCQAAYRAKHPVGISPPRRLRPGIYN